MAFFVLQCGRVTGLTCRATVTVGGVGAALDCRMAAWGVPGGAWEAGAAGGGSAAAACCAEAMVARIPAVKVTRGCWLGTLCVIFTFFRPSSVNISVNWLM